MATILRSYKYVNFFSGYHIKPFQSSSKLQSALRSTSAVKTNGNNAVLRNVFLPDSDTELSIIERIRRKYFIKYYATFEDVSKLVTNIYNNANLNYQIIDNMKNSDLIMLIRCCGNKMKFDMPEQRLNVLDLLCQVFKSKGFQFDVNHYNAIIEVYLENEKDFSATDFLTEMINNNVQPNTLTYEYLLTYYCQKGNVSDANKILHYFKENEIPINERIFSALIIGNAEANDMNGALNILNTMKVMGCIPSSKAYSALLYSYAKKGDIENIMSTLKTCEQNNIIIDDGHIIEIIYHLSVNGHSEHVDRIIPLFSWKQISSIIHIFIAKLLHKKQINIAYRLISEAIEKCDDNSKLPLAFQFLKVIGICKLPLEELIKYLNSFEQLNIPAYQTVIFTCFIKEINDYCIPFFKAWQERGGLIKEHFFWPVLKICESQKDSDILEIVKAMKNDFNIEPGEDTLYNFIVPHVLSQDTPNFAFKKLIDDIQLSPKIVIDTILHYAVYHKNSYLIKKCLEFSFDRNINYDKEKFYHHLQSKGNIENIDILPYSFLYKMAKKIPRLKHLDSIFLLEKYCQEENILEAENLMDKLKRSKINVCFDKILNYFELLVKKDRIDDGFEILQHFVEKRKVIISNDHETIEKVQNALNLLTEKGSVDGINKFIDILKNIKLKINKKITEYLIDVHLQQNNFDECLEVLKKIKQEYGFYTHDDKVMEACIKVEDVNSLQLLTNLSNSHLGYTHTLFNLSIAFLKNNREIQSKQVLKSGKIIGNRETAEILRNVIQKLLLKDEFSVVKKFMQITKGGRLDREQMYNLVLERYSVMNNWEEGLKLIQEMMIEKIRPSKLISLMLEELLKRNDQSIPDSIKTYIKIYDESKKNNNYDQIIKQYIDNYQIPSFKYLNLLLENSAKNGDIKSINLIHKTYNIMVYENIDKSNIFESFEKCNQVSTYLNYINEAIKNDNDRQLSNISKSCNYKTLKCFIKNPEHFEHFKSLAIKLYKKNEYYYHPLLTVISYECYKNPQNIYSMLKNYGLMKKTYFSYKFITNSLVEAECFDKLQKVAELFDSSTFFNQQSFYDAFLRSFDNIKQYNKGFEILLRKELSNKSKENEEFGNVEANQFQATV